MQISSLFKTSFISTFLRFSLAVICCAALTGYLLFPDINILKFHNASLILCCGAVWFTASKLLNESLALPYWYFYALSLPTFGGLAYYLYCLPMLDPSGTWPASLILLGLLLLTFIAPFIARRSDSDDIWSFQFDTLKNTLVAEVANLILLIGICLVLFALDYLLSIKFYSSIYNDIIIIMISFILPVMILSGIPTNFEDTTVPSTGSILLKLLTYILIPLLIVYGVILHTYSLKIMITQTLPRGKVTYLVAGFETFILIAYTLTQRWKADHNPIRLFHRYVGWFMIMPLILMAWGIWERVSVFGLTEARYFIALLWAWFAISTTIILLRTSKPALWIVGMLSGLLLMGSMGSWGIVELPIKQQIQKLKTTLLNIRSIEKKTLTKEHKLIVSSILDYLSARNRLGDVQHLYLNSNNPLSTEKLSAKNVGIELGVPYIEYSERARHRESYAVHYKNAVNSLSLQGYTYIIPNIKLSTYGHLSQPFDIKDVGSFKVSYFPTTLSFEITQAGTSTPIYQAHMPELINKLATGSRDTLHNNPALTTQSKNGTTFQVTFTTINAYSNTDKSLVDRIDELCFILLIQINSKK